MRYYWICLWFILSNCTDKRNFAVNINPITDSSDTVIAADAGFDPGLIELNPSSPTRILALSPVETLAKKDFDRVLAPDNRYFSRSLRGGFVSRPKADSNKVDITRISLQNSTFDSLCSIQITTISATANLFIKSYSDSTYNRIRLQKQSVNGINHFSTVFYLPRSITLRIVVYTESDTSHVGSQIRFSTISQRTKEVEKVDALYSLLAIMTLASVILLVLAFLKSKDSIYIAATFYLFFYGVSFLQQVDTNFQFFSSHNRLLIWGGEISYFIILFILPFRVVKYSWQAVMITVMFALCSILHIIDFSYIDLTKYLIVLSYPPYLLQRKQLPERYLLPFIISILLVIIMIVELVIQNLMTWPYLYKAYRILEVINLVFLSVAIVSRYISQKKADQIKKTNQVVSQQKLISEKVIESIETERARIARDLHDELGGNLALLKLKVESLNNNTDDWESANRIINQTTDSLRTISHELMPPYFEKTGLIAILHENFYTINLNSQAKFKLNVTGIKPQLSNKGELMIYRISMELIQNCLKHSRASEVTMELNFFKDRLNMICEDNGQGFVGDPGNGIGLKNLHSRVSYLGGDINIDSNTYGTTIIINIPLDPSL